MKFVYSEHGAGLMTNRTAFAKVRGRVRREMRGRVFGDVATRAGGRGGPFRVHISLRVHHVV